MGSLISWGDDGVLEEQRPSGRAELRVMAGPFTVKGSRMK